MLTRRRSSWLSVGLTIGGLLACSPGLPRRRPLAGRRVDTGSGWRSAGGDRDRGLPRSSPTVLPLAESRDASKTFGEPSPLRPDLFSAHPLGTDKSALDMLGGVIYGARLSLQIGLGATASGSSSAG